MSILTFLMILAVAFLAGVEGILDEFQFHQPLVACTLIGLVSGHLSEGILLGGYLQMMALGWANVGAAVAPDIALASVASGILMVQGLSSSVDPDLVISGAIGIAIPLSVIGLFLTKLCRTRAISFVQNMDAAAQEGNMHKMEFWHRCGIVMQGCRVMIPALVLLMIPTSWIAIGLESLPLWILEGLRAARGLIPALGFAIVINVLASKETWVFFALGFCLACIQSLSLVALSVLGAGMMLIYMILKIGESSGPEIELGDILDSPKDR